MNITLNIVLEALGMTADERIGSVEFARSIYPGDECTNFDPAVLYIMDYEKALPYCKASSGMFCLCPAVKEPVADIPCNLIPVQGEPSLLRLMQRVQDAFFEIGQWNRAMHLSLIRGKGVQDLLDLCEPILKNSVQITDSATSLIACTRGIEATDRVSISLRQHGYFTDEIMAVLGGARTLTVWETLSGLGVVNFPHIWPFDLVYNVHSFQNTYYNHTVMMCDHVPLTPGLKDKFTMLVENLSVCIEANWKHERSQKQTHIALFKALIDGVCNPPDTIESIVDASGLPHNGHFLFLQLQSHALNQISLARMIHELRELLPNGLVSTYEGNVVALLHSGTLKALFPEEAQQRLVQHLDYCGTCCGISEAFTDLKDTATAFRQAGLALRFGSQQRCSILGPTAPAIEAQQRIYDYTAFGAHYLLSDLSVQNQALWDASHYGKLIYTLWQSDKNRQTCYLSVLYTYLNCERNATTAGKLLHMHRNNVIYHIGKIQEFLGVDLDDPHVRFNLLVSCTILAMNISGNFDE